MYFLSQRSEHIAIFYLENTDLKISLEEDLGVFAPIRESLEKVQQGFKKAAGFGIGAMDKKPTIAVTLQKMKDGIVTNISIFFVKNKKKQW